MFGLADATSARVGAHLGRGAPKAAARAAGSALRLMLAASVVLSAALIALREQLGPLFSHDPKASAHVHTKCTHEMNRSITNEARRAGGRWNAHQPRPHGTSEFYTKRINHQRGATVRAAGGLRSSHDPTMADDRPHDGSHDLGGRAPGVFARVVAPATSRRTRRPPAMGRSNPPPLRAAAQRARPSL